MPAQGHPHRIAFVRLHDVPPEAIMAHMTDPRVAAHMPLFDFTWTPQRQAAFLAAKQACWQRDGLGHWAILRDGVYAGWGGFERDGDAWDFGLVLKPDCFGLGLSVLRKALAIAGADARIAAVTFLLPRSRKRMRALERLGARFIGQVRHGGADFCKFRLKTPGEGGDCGDSARK